MNMKKENEKGTYHTVDLKARAHELLAFDFIWTIHYYPEDTRALTNPASVCVCVCVCVFVW